MSSKDTCSMQYYYPSKDLTDKYKIDCSDKNFADIDNFEMFKNNNFLKFVNDKYGNDAFKDNSPFTFKEDYINLTNDDICKTVDYSLKPQQKFMGQFINPSTNFKNSLVFHGLGSGKTCTSLVIGEAFKKTTSTKLLYVVPAPLVDQVRDEILGELETITEEQEAEGKVPEIWSCTSQCVINGKRDFYSNINDRDPNSHIKDRVSLKEYEEVYSDKRKKLNDLSLEINRLLKLKQKEDTIPLKKQFLKLQNEVNQAFTRVKNKKDTILSNVTKVFEIESHIVFIKKLFKETKDGTWTKKEHLTDKKSPILSSNGILVIDEIQRLVSEGGVLYNKLFSAIYQYINPLCRIVLLSATPIYDNPYELALTMNLLRPRMPFPLTKEKFYSIFLGKYNEEDDCVRIKSNNFITNDSCVINKNLLKILSAGYVSYFRGGNPIAYPYKRIIVLEHKMAARQKEQYINALRSDINKDLSIYSKILKGDEFLIKGDSSENKKDDVVSGIYVTTQQFSNIALPIKKSDVVDDMLSKDSQSQIKSGLQTLKTELKKLKAKNPEEVLNYIRKKGYSEKFVSILELSFNCDGPVFIFSNWLQFGVEALSIILDACGYSKFPNEGINRYFVWSSETSIDKPLIRKAKSTYNSMDNKDGSLIKIILGTRSIMEGVSFKNVKQVHITDPWWNEARIEQILARGVRFCSHSNLPLNEQYTDIFRHYSVLPMMPDHDVLEMFQSLDRKRYKNFENFTIEQKMVTSALKKYQINNEFEETLKQVAYDCDLNKNGNIIRLEENVRPLSTGEFQIYFKNPKTLELFEREGIPDKLTIKQILDRDFSYPNDSKLPIIFHEVEINDDNLVKIVDDESGEFNTLKEPVINKNLTLYENIKCWKSDLTIQNIFDKINEDPDNKDITEYFMRIQKNFELYPVFRKNILGEKTLPERIEFENVEKVMKGKKKLLDCLKVLSESDLTSKEQKNKIKNLLKKQDLNKKIIDIVYTYNWMPESMIEELQTLDSKTLNELLQEAKNFHQ